MHYRSMELSLAAAKIDRIRSVMKKARQEVDKIDNERVNPLLFRPRWLRRAIASLFLFSVAW